MVFGSLEPTFSKPKHRHAAICVLSAINIMSLVATANLVLVLNPEDRISMKCGGALTGLGFVYFMTLFELLNVVALYTGAGARLRHKYALTSGDVLDINNKVVSAVQAAFCVLTGAVVCTYSCARDFLRTSHYMSEAYAWFGAAYFFYDIWSMYMVHIQMTQNVPRAKVRAQSAGGGAGAGAGAGAAVPSFFSYCFYEPVILFHHLFIGGFGFLVIVYFRGNLGDCTFGFVYLMEVSTPFVSARGILSRLRLKASPAYVVNGLAMLATFFVCRVLSLPYVCLIYSRTLGVSYVEAIKTLPIGCKISICILLLPQLYWFYLMSAGALKIFFKNDKSGDKSGDKSSDKLGDKSSDKLGDKFGNKLGDKSVFSGGDVVDKRS